MRNGDLAKLFPAKPLATRSLTPSGRIGGRKIDALQSGVGIAEVEDANRRIHDCLRDLLAQRRSNPSDDLFSEMMQVEIDGDRIGAEELVFLSGCASGQDGNVDGASRVAGGMRGHSAGRAAGMGAGPGRPHASPAGHHDQENETVARMIGKPDARRRIWRTPRMDQPAKFVIRFFETVTHGDPA